MTLRFITLLLGIALLSGCSTVHFNNVHMEKDGTPVATKLTARQKESISSLKLALKSLDANTSEQEAAIIAFDTVVYTMILANKYELKSPPLYHNYLVNSKKRSRGLCYHWQRDLMTQLKKRHLKTFDLKEAVANEAKYWTEHNVMVITAKGKPFNSGIIFDGWRHSGDLLWMKVSEDKKYKWKQRVWSKEQLAKAKIPKAS